MQSAGLHVGPGRCRIGAALSPGQRSYKKTKPGFSFCLFSVAVFLRSERMFAFVVLGSVSSVLAWKERLRNDVFCVEWDTKS